MMAAGNPASAAILEAINTASHQHGAARTDTLSVAVLMLLSAADSNEGSGGFSIPLFATLGGRLGEAILADSHGYSFGRLCSSDAFSLLFALAAYRINADELQAHTNAPAVLVAGMNRLFWRDADRAAATFEPVYQGLLHLTEALATHAGSAGARPADVDAGARPFVELACRFYLLYASPRDFPAFLSRMYRPVVRALLTEGGGTAAGSGAGSASTGRSTAAAAEMPAVSSTGQSSGSSGLAPAAEAVASAVERGDSGIARLPLSPSSRREVAAQPVLPLFVREACAMLTGLRSEETALRYLERLGALGMHRRAAGGDGGGSASSSAVRDSATSAASGGERGGGSALVTAAVAGTEDDSHALALDSHSAARLLTALDTLGTPGGPLYPTARVRRTARRVTRAIFPHGYRARRSVQTCFRLLHPVALAKASANAIASCSVRGGAKPAAGGAGSAVTHRLEHSHAAAAASDSEGEGEGETTAATGDTPQSWLPAAASWLLYPLQLATMGCGRRR